MFNFKDKKTDKNQPKTTKANSQKIELKKVVVIGSGISGLATAWLLHCSKKYDVTLLESSDTFGGHAHAVPVSLQEKKGFRKTKKTAWVDTGFLVFNHKTYPHLTHFFQALGVDIANSDMSFGVSVKQKNQTLEWSGTNAFAQKRRFVSKNHWRMIYDIYRIEKKADELLIEAKTANMTLAEMLEKHKFSDAFINNYLLPMASAIWSTSVDEIRDFPAELFLTFCMNHMLFSLSGRPQWKTVYKTSRQYVLKVINALPDARIKHHVTQISNKNGKHIVHFLHKTSKQTIEADIVVMACHTDTASKIVNDIATAEQLSVLNDIEYSQNHAYLHTDITQMPKNQKVWSSWNYLADFTNTNGKTDNDATKEQLNNAVTVSYWINRLQPFVPLKTNLFVTLNPYKDIAESKILNRFSYSHPKIDKKTVNAQKRLPNYQGDNNLYFAGAWTRYGFHEDGILSAVNVATLLDAPIPWNIPKDWDEKHASHAKQMINEIN